MFRHSRAEENSFSLSNSSIKNENQKAHYRRQRTNSNDQFNSQQTSNIPSKVYVGNVPREKLSDRELLHFFKSFGQISDIGVSKDYLFVEYQRIADAKKLIEKGESSLILKGNKLDIFSSMDGYSNDRNSSSIRRSDQHYSNSEKELSKNFSIHSNDHRHSSNYQPPRKRCAYEFYVDDQLRLNSKSTNILRKDSNMMEMNENEKNDSISRSRRYSGSLNRSSNEFLFGHDQSNYTILSGPDHRKEFVHCRIILVNPRQRKYAEQISSDLHCHGLFTSIILLRETYTLTEAIEDAANDRCLYGIIAMPIHEQRRAASFHILHEQIQEHRNLTLKDGYQIVLNDFARYKQRLQNEKMEKINEQNEERSAHSHRKEFIHHEEKISSISKTNLSEKLPLAMLLCLLADGRQLTFDEIDRILLYLLEKKGKLLTLPQGTLPPLPAQYATSQCQSNPGKNHFPEPSSTMLEQIRQILSTNVIESSSWKKFNENEKEFDTSKQSFSSSKCNSTSLAVAESSFHYPSTKESSSNIPFPFRFSSTTNSNENLYPILPNSAAADAAAAIFRAYSQFNLQTTTNLPH